MFEIKEGRRQTLVLPPIFDLFAPWVENILNQKEWIRILRWSSRTREQRVQSLSNEMLWSVLNRAKWKRHFDCRENDGRVCEKLLIRVNGAWVLLHTVSAFIAWSWISIRRDASSWHILLLHNKHSVMIFTFVDKTFHFLKTLSLKNSWKFLNCFAHFVLSRKFIFVFKPFGVIFRKKGWDWLKVLSELKLFLIIEQSDQIWKLFNPNHFFFKVWTDESNSFKFLFWAENYTKSAVFKFIFIIVYFVKRNQI